MSLRRLGIFFGNFTRLKIFLDDCRKQGIPNLRAGREIKEIDLYTRDGPRFIAVYAPTIFRKDELKRHRLRCNPSEFGSASGIKKAIDEDLIIVDIVATHEARVFA